MCRIKYKDNSGYIDICEKAKHKRAKKEEYITIFLSREHATNWLMKHSFNVNNFEFEDVRI